MNYAMNEISTVWNRKDEPARISGGGGLFPAAPQRFIPRPEDIIPTEMFDCIHK